MWIIILHEHQTIIWTNDILIYALLDLDELGINLTRGRSGSNNCDRDLVQGPEPLQRRHNRRDGVSNHQPRDCLLNRLFGRRSKKTSKLRVNGLCAGNSAGTGEFPAQRASNAENVFIWWRHHDKWGQEVIMEIGAS